MMRCWETRRRRRGKEKESRDRARKTIYFLSMTVGRRGKMKKKPEAEWGNAGQAGRGGGDWLALSVFITRVEEEWDEPRWSREIDR